MESLLRYRPESLEAFTEDGRTAWKVRWRDIRWIAVRQSTDPDKPASTRVRTHDGSILDCPKVHPMASLAFFVGWLSSRAGIPFTVKRGRRRIRTVLWDAHAPDTFDLPRFARRGVGEWNERELPEYPGKDRRVDPRDRHAPPARVVRPADDLEVWSRRFPLDHGIWPGFGTRPNPAGLGTRLVLNASMRKGLFAFDRDTGARRWRASIGGSFSHPPIFAGRRVIVSSFTSLLAVDVASGRRSWTFDPPDRNGELSYSDPTVDGRDLVIGDNRGRLHLLDGRTGRLRWSVRLHGRGRLHRVVCTPLLTQDRVFATTLSGWAFALDRRTGAPVWRQRIPRHAGGEILSWKGGVVVPATSTVLLLDERTGSVRRRWRFTGRWISVVMPTPDALVIQHRGSPYRPLSNPKPAYTAVGLRGTRWEAPANGWSMRARYAAETGLIYEDTKSGITIIDPERGRRLVDIDVGDLGHHGPLPLVTDDRIYLATGPDDPRLLALRHP